MRRLPLSMILLLALGASGTIALAQDAYAPADGGNVHYAWANVTRVNPIYQNVQVSTPRQDCREQEIVRESGGNHTAATVLGAIVGGALGTTIGKGDGRKAATVAGAVIGGTVGNSAAGSNGQRAPETVTRCRQVNDVSSERRITGYSVEYRYRGYVYTSRLDYDPGTRLRVRVSVTPAD